MLGRRVFESGEDLRRQVLRVPVSLLLSPEDVALLVDDSAGARAFLASWHVTYDVVRSGSAVHNVIVKTLPYIIDSVPASPKDFLEVRSSGDFFAFRYASGSNFDAPRSSALISWWISCLCRDSWMTCGKVDLV
jgi:hypothetical protein